MIYVNAREVTLTDNGSDIFKQINESAALSLWHSYCDKKIELENANDRIETLESVLCLLLQEHDLYLLEGGPSSEAWDKARAVLEKTNE